ncbi:MAG TPA: hypothetical protein V6C71_04600 [Coleofasciculaceae cyanobacterium]|jgi:hypothetical protein
MNNKVNQRLLAFSSLIIVFFISGFLRDAATKVVTNRFNERHFDRTPQDDWDWECNRSVADSYERQKIYPREREYSQHQEFHRYERHFQHQFYHQHLRHSHGLVEVQAGSKDGHSFFHEKRLYKYDYIND